MRGDVNERKDQLTWTLSAVVLGWRDKIKRKFAWLLTGLCIFFSFWQGKRNGKKWSHALLDELNFLKEKRWYRDDFLTGIRL